jgi:hypothetical protein|tara:strand:- start:269 stop:439 length:171 start_codon:yes stop_codon:yes gene_type:complete
MKHKFTFRDTFDVPKVETSKDYSPSWWEGWAVIILYFGKKIIIIFAIIFIFLKFFK